MVSIKYDVVVIGAGPAGYTAAIRASQMGARTALIEKGKAGGACLNHACIPTKFLLHTTDIVQNIKSASRYGIDTIYKGINWAALQERKSATISMLANGLKGLLASNNIEVISGNACFAMDNSIEITDHSGHKTAVAAGKTIIATGSYPAKLDIKGGGNPAVLYSQDLLELPHLPQSLAIIGGGAVGVEFATIFARLGCQVHLVEMMPHILPSEDAEITGILEQSLKRSHIKLYTSAKIERIENSGRSQIMKLNIQDKKIEIESELVAAGIGQRPYFEELGLSSTGINHDNHGIKVDEHMATSVPGIYAAGDVTGKTMFAHAGMAQGKIAAENAMGLNSVMDYKAMPRCIFSRPEFAAAGLNESEAKTQGHTVKCGRFPFTAASAATIRGERQGMVKIVADAHSDKILGVQILGASASTLIAEAVLALQMGATSRDLENTIHAHPTLPEALWDATLDMNGRGINFKR